MERIGLVVATAVAVVAAVRGTWSPCGLSMVSAINPLAERSRGYRYWATALWFVLGASTGGAVLGGVAAVGSWAATPLRAHESLAFAVAVTACLVTLAADLRLGGFGLPMHPRQVNELWLTRYRRWLYASGFGFQIGIGFATYIMTAAVYLTVALAALTCPVPWAFAVGVTFGLVRGVEVLLTSRMRQPEDLHRLHRWLDAAAPWSVLAVRAAQCGAAVVLGAAAAGATGAAAAAAAVGAVLAVAARQPGRHEPARVG